MDSKVAVRLHATERDELVDWAYSQIALTPALKAHLLHIDGRPKISAIIRYAALRETRRHDA